MKYLYCLSKDINYSHLPKHSWGKHEKLPERGNFYNENGDKLPFKSTRRSESVTHKSL